MTQKECKIKERAALMKLIGTALDAVVDVRLYAKDWDLLNSQEYINFEDELNKLSVEDPNE